MTWESLSTLSLDGILDWARVQPWGRAMAACLQDAAWHAEGDVWTHTVLVGRQLLRLDEWPSLSSHEQIVLIFTALFHDAGKPLTSQVDPITGRIRSPKHAVKGEQLVRTVLRELGCPLAIREEIARMVRVHGRPAFLLERPDPEREVITQSWQVTNRLLYLFALADTRGRDTAELGRPEENLHLWKLVAEEMDCFTQPYPFANDRARFRYLHQSEADRHFIPHESYRCTVTMMSGLPGSGKDRWLATHRPGLPVVSLDDIRGELDLDATDNQGQVIQLAKERCRELLRADTSFAFNATNLLRQTRARWIELFVDYDARVEIVYIEPPLSIILRQNRERMRNVPESVIQPLTTKLEPPTWSEAHDLTLCEEVAS